MKFAISYMRRGQESPMVRQMPKLRSPIVTVARRSNGLSRLLAILGAVVVVGTTFGWLTLGETPAAQQLIETIKPYDPLN